MQKGLTPSWQSIVSTLGELALVSLSLPRVYIVFYYWYFTSSV